LYLVAYKETKFKSGTGYELHSDWFASLPEDAGTSATSSGGTKGKASGSGNNKKRSSLKIGKDDTVDGDISVGGTGKTGETTGDINVNLKGPITSGKDSVKGPKKKSKIVKGEDEEVDAEVDLAMKSEKPDKEDITGDISVSMAAPQLEVTYMKLMMVGAKGLPKALQGKGDPFARVKLGEAQFRTQVATGKIPEIKWNEAFLLQLQGDWKTQDMEITVMIDENKSIGSGNSHLGDSMKNAKMAEDRNFTLPLKDKNKDVGVVIFSITLYSSPPDGFDLPEGTGGEEKGKDGDESSSEEEEEDSSSGEDDDDNKPNKKRIKVKKMMVKLM